MQLNNHTQNTTFCLSLFISGGHTAHHTLIYIYQPTSFSVTPMTAVYMCCVYSDLYISWYSELYTHMLIGRLALWVSQADFRLQSCLGKSEFLLCVCQDSSSSRLISSQKLACLDESEIVKPSNSSKPKKMQLNVQPYSHTLLNTQRKVWLHVLPGYLTHSLSVFFKTWLAGRR